MFKIRLNLDLDLCLKCYNCAIFVVCRPEKCHEKCATTLFASCNRKLFPVCHFRFYTTWPWKKKQLSWSKNTTCRTSSFSDRSSSRLSSGWRPGKTVSPFLFVVFMEHMCWVIGVYRRKVWKPCLVPKRASNAAILTTHLQEMSFSPISWEQWRHVNYVLWYGQIQVNEITCSPFITEFKSRMI